MGTRRRAIRRGWVAIGQNSYGHSVDLEVESATIEAT